MDSRLVFRHRSACVINAGGTQRGKQGAPIGHGASPFLCQAAIGKSVVAVMSEGRGEVSGRPGATLLILDWQENPRRECAVRPYRKPTQVGGDQRPQAVERTLGKELGKRAS